MDKRVDLALALVVAATGAGIIWIASGFRVGSFPDPVTTRGLPYFTGGFMVVGGLALAARRLLAWSQIPGHLAVAEGKVDEAEHASSTLRPLAIVALALLWVLLLRRLGYLILTPPLILSMLWLMRVRSPAKLFGFGVGFPLLIWLVFSQVLNVALPLGPLTALARSYGLSY